MNISSQDAATTFTIAAIPDTQNYVDYRNQSEYGFPCDAREIFWDQMQYIARRAVGRGGDIAFVTGLGDSWQHPSVYGVDPEHAALGLSEAPNPIIERLLPPAPDHVIDVEIPAVVAGYKIIDGLVPFAVTPGNHDHDYLWTDSNHPPSEDARIADGQAYGLGSLHVGELVNWTKAFGARSEFFKDKPWYVSHFRDGSSSAQIFSGGGYKFLHIALEMQPHEEALAWAQSVLDMFPSHPTILSTHDFLDTQGQRQPHPCLDFTRIDSERNSAEAVWEKLIRPNDQILMTLNGHNHGAVHRIDLNASGHKVFQFLCDYQDRRQCLEPFKDKAKQLIDGIGDGWLRLIDFDLGQGRAQMRIRAYSSYFKAYASDLALYASWYRLEHAELTPDEFLAEDDRQFEIDHFHTRFVAARI